jgi:hypothetical protein
LCIDLILKLVAPLAARSYSLGMCRNITILRGLEPEASPEEIEAAARQYIRKVSGVTTVTPRTSESLEKAIDAVARATSELLRELPARQRPPTTVPPLRRRALNSGG